MKGELKLKICIAIMLILMFVSARLNYPIISLDRQAVLKTLYESYPEKCNVHVGKKVIHVEPHEHGVRVKTDDGAVYYGDIVVGADGIHSQIRSEIWRLADTKCPGLITPTERTRAWISVSLYHMNSLSPANVRNRSRFYG
jgi:2-polyprenyl-6-methoxyphenol hydroxylase-like FAD-dependent oxidoreductase